LSASLLIYTKQAKLAKTQANIRRKQAELATLYKASNAKLAKLKLELELELELAYSLYISKASKACFYRYTEQS
jgi:hypothetical protein